MRPWIRGSVGILGLHTDTSRILMRISDCMLYSINIHPWISLKRIIFSPLFNSFTCQTHFCTVLSRCSRTTTVCNRYIKRSVTLNGQKSTSTRLSINYLFMEWKDAYDWRQCLWYSFLWLIKYNRQRGIIYSRFLVTLKH